VSAFPVGAHGFRSSATVFVCDLTKRRVSPYKTGYCLSSRYETSIVSETISGPGEEKRGSEKKGGKRKEEKEGGGPSALHAPRLGRLTGGSLSTRTQPHSNAAYIVWEGKAHVHTQRQYVKINEKEKEEESIPYR